MRRAAFALAACVVLVALHGSLSVEAREQHRSRHGNLSPRLRSGGKRPDESYGRPWDSQDPLAALDHMDGTHDSVGKHPTRFGRMGGQTCQRPYLQCFDSCDSKVGQEACDCYQAALVCMQTVREKFREMPFGCTEAHATKALHYWRRRAIAATCSEQQIPQLRVESGACGPDFPVQSDDCSKTTYTHFTASYHTAWFPSAFNFSQLYTPSNEVVLQMQVCLDAGDEAGVDIYFEHNGNKVSSLKLEPSGSDQTCSAKFFTSPWSLDISSNQKTDQWFMPNTGVLTNGATWAMQIHNRNWIHEAHVQAKFELTCGAMGKPMGTDMCSESKLHVYRSPVDAANPVYVTGGCAFNPYGPTPPTCNSGAKFCCPSGRSPPSSSVCGENCYNCHNSC